jgi:hypothetical protein
MPNEHQHEPAYGDLKLAIALLLKRLDLRRAFVCKIGPTAEIQDQVLACALCVREVIKIYNAAIRRAYKVHPQD